MILLVFQQMIFNGFMDDHFHAGIEINPKAVLRFQGVETIEGDRKHIEVR